MCVFQCTHMYNTLKNKNKIKIKTPTPIYFNPNYHTEKEQVPIIMDYSLFQFDALIFFLGMRPHGGLDLTLIYSILSPQIFRQNRKVRLKNCLETNFHNISNIKLRVIKRRNYN